MKWKICTGGEVRYVTRFLFCPKIIGDTAKWLMIATWQEGYGLSTGWVATKWIEKEEK